MQKKVLIPTKLDAIAARLLEDSGRYIVAQDAATDLLQLAAQHPDTYALIVRSEKVTAEVIDALPQLKVVVRAGAGYNTIDTKYARKMGIDVMNTPGANSNAVAELAIAMMLADARHLVPADQSTRAGEWEKKKFMGKELSGKNVGIVGLGNIGRLVAKRLQGFGCNMYGYDPVISNERARDMGVELVDLPALFSRCDFISLHMPENEDTRGIVNAQLLANCREGATIVNCARSGVVVEEDLRKIKQDKQLHFLNDVYDADKAGPKSCSDIAELMLPHLGASTFEANAKAAQRAAEQLIDLDTKGITSFIVNRDIPEGLAEEYCDLANMLARLCRCLVGAKCPLKLVETSFYGELKPFGDWLMVPIVAGLAEDFDRTMDYQSAREYLDEMGLEYVNRDVDDDKGYGESITVDLTSEIDSDNLRHISIRGTVTEGLLMVARINEFHKLYFEPQGFTVFFLYEDRPGVLGAIGNALAKHGINIEDVRNPHDQRTNRSLAIMKVDQNVTEDVMKLICSEIKAISGFSIKL